MSCGNSSTWANDSVAPLSHELPESYCDGWKVHYFKDRSKKERKMKILITQ